MKNILIVLLTSLFWATILMLFFEPRSFEAQELTPVEVEAPAPKTEKAKRSVSSDKSAEIVKQQPANTTPKEDKIDYSREIVGKWTPVEGAKYTLEFTKYGTAIQHIGSTQIRYDYSLSGDKLNIQYSDSRIAISKDAKYYYLEIYNSREFSGRYRRSK